MSPRDDDLAKLAGLLNWAVAYSPTGIYFYRHDGDGIDIPAPDAPLPEALAFVGRIAEALGPGITLDAVNNDRAHGWMVRFAKPWPTLFRGTAPDLAWAAVRAAIAAKGGAT